MDKLKKRKIIAIVVSVAILTTSLGLYLGLPKPKEYINEGVMGGINLQTIIDANVPSQKPIGNNILSSVDKVDKLINPKTETSDIYKINHSKAGEKVKVDTLTINLLKKSFDVYQKSGGLYNPAVYTLVDLWQFSADKFDVSSEHKEPSTADIDVGKQLAETFSKIVFINDVKNATIPLDSTFIVDIVNNTVTRTNACFIGNFDAKIDLGGIAKGYAVELCYNVFKQSNARSGLVNLGGNIYGYNKDWKIGIENPFKAEKLPNGTNESNILGVVTLNNTSVSCSGVYERNYTIENKFYHHIINPKTGYPTEINNDNIVMACVIGKDGAITDALATTMVLLSTIDNCKNFLQNNYNDLVSTVILVTKDRHYSVIGEQNFTFNEEEMVGFTKIND